jgi:hypothetical protein
MGLVSPNKPILNCAPQFCTLLLPAMLVRDQQTDMLQQKPS